MKRLFKTNFSVNSGHAWLLILRVAAGAFMLTHGYPKLEKLLTGGEIQFADPFGAGPTVSLLLAVFAEFLCSALIILGLATRLATIPIIVTMLVAALHIHTDDPFGKKELPLLYVLIFVTLCIFGPGKYSLDNVISRQRRL